MSVDALPQAAHPPGACSFWWEAAGAGFQSPLTGTQQRVHFWGKWKASMTWDVLDLVEAADVLAFLQSQAWSHVFTIFDPMRVVPRGLARGTSTSDASVNGIVAGGAQTGRTLITAWPTGQYNEGDVLFQPFDLFGSIETGELYEINTKVTLAAAVVCDGAGGRPAITGSPTMHVATLPFNQYIRTSPGTETSLCAEACPVRVWLDKSVRPDGAPPLIYTFTADMTEDLNPAPA